MIHQGILDSSSEQARRKRSNTTYSSRMQAHAHYPTGRGWTLNIELTEEKIRVTWPRRYTELTSQRDSMYSFSKLYAESQLRGFCDHNNSGVPSSSMRSMADCDEEFRIGLVKRLMDGVEWHHDQGLEVQIRQWFLLKKQFVKNVHDIKESMYHWKDGVLGLDDAIRLTMLM